MANPYIAVGKFSFAQNDKSDQIVLDATNGATVSVNLAGTWTGTIALQRISSIGAVTTVGSYTANGSYDYTSPDTTSRYRLDPSGLVSGEPGYQLYASDKANLVRTNALPELLAANISRLSTPTGISAAGGVAARDQPSRMKLLGRNYGPIAATGTTTPNLDWGATGRAQYTAKGAISQIQIGFCSRQAAGNTLGEGGSAITPQIARVTLEDSTATYLRNVLTDGQPDIVVPGSAANGIALTDITGYRLAAGASFWARTHQRTAKPPTSPAGTPIAGGILTAGTYLYVLTTVDQAGNTTIESGPTADISVTTATTNLTAQLSWTAPTFGKFINIYRTAAGGGTGTGKFLAQVPISQTSFADLGVLATNSAIAIPTQTAISMTRIALTNESGNTPDAGGGNDGSDQTATTGTVGTVSLNTNVYIPTPTIMLGNDMKNPAALGLGDSILSGVGLRNIAGIHNYAKGSWFDQGLTTGTFAGTANLGMASSAIKDIFSGFAPSNFRLGYIRWADYVVDEYGHNDIYGGSQTWQQVAANKILLAKYCYDQGVRYYTTTLTPTTASADNYLTIANQSIPNAGQETARLNFNIWVRNGCLVDGSGAPVASGGTPSPYIYGYFDLAGPVEVNASNILTANGGYWLVPTVADFTAQVMTGTPSTTSITGTGTPYAAPTGSVTGLPTKAIKITSGTRNGQTATISTNTTSALTIYANGSVALTGVAVVGLAGAPAAADTYEIWSPYTNDGVHPSLAGHTAMGASFSTWATTALVPFGSMLA